MAEKSTFVMVDRNIMRWSWYSDHKTVHLFLHLIMKANVSDHKFKDMIIHRGQLFTSLPSLASEAYMTVNEVRTVLKRLVSTGEITDEAQPFGRLITVVSYDSYQGGRTGKSQPKHRQSTGKSQQYNNDNKDTNVSNNEKKDAAPATPDGGGRAEWEIRLNVPEKFVGRFDDEASWLSFWNNEGWDPH